MEADSCTYTSRTLPTELSFKEPLGIMVWAAQAAHWSLRNSLIRGGLPSYDQFLMIWIKFVSFMISWEPLSAFSDVFSQFHKALGSLSLRGILITAKIVYVPSVEAQEERAVKRQRQVQRKFKLATLPEEQIQQWIDCEEFFCSLH